MKVQKISRNFMLVLVTGMLLSCSLSNIQLTKYRHPIKIHTSLQDDFLEDNYQAVGRYASGQEELSRPNPVELSWKFKKQENANFIVKISENKDLSNPIIMETSSLSVSVYNLKIGTKYYWNVSADDYDNSYTSATDTFEIEGYGPRNLYVDGVTNVRDVGGWKIDDTYRVKQGLFYRSGRFNTSESSTVIKEITSAGEKVLLEDLKIKSEMDLRRIDNNEVGSITSSVLGDSVTYFSCPMEWNGNILELNTEMVRHIFSDILSKEENYPLIFHCNIGTDRTGMIAYLLNGLLGVSEDDLYYDYLFSNFGRIGGLRTAGSISNNYVATIKYTDGDTLPQKISNYLLSIGVTSEEINAIKTMFIEKI